MDRGRRNQWIATTEIGFAFDGETNAVFSGWCCLDAIPSWVWKMEARVGAMTRETIDISLMRMFMDGPDVSLKGSPTVSPVTEALWGSDFL